MSIIALLIGYLVYYVVYVICYNVFGDAGFLFYLGTFISHSVGACLGAIVTGKIEFKKHGTSMNFLIPLMFFLTIFGCIVGVIRFGWGEIWEYLVSLVGLFVAFGFFNMYVDKSEKR
jgi:hypothetical protein